MKFINVETIPSGTGGRNGWRKPEDADAIAELKANRGRWGEWPREFGTPQHAYSFAYQLKRRFPGVETMARTINGEPTVYAHWPKTRRR